ncbi:rhamnan synthesis F family protein [Jhaorihella thermophila]
MADGQLVEGDAWWGINRLRAEALLNRAGLSTEGRVLRFAAGSIYWIKPTLIARLAALNLKAEDFEPEQALVDGTTAHAIERALGVLADAAGLGQLESRDLDRKPPAPGAGRIEIDEPRRVTGKNGQDDTG